ncbi:MAG: YitT family protein [Bacteroidota bacterium]
MLKKAKISISELYTFKSFFTTIIGVSLGVFALKGFMIPNLFMDGGVTGISLLMHEIYHLNFSAVFLLINFAFCILAYKYVSKLFAIRTFLAVLVLCIGVEFIHIHAVTTDKLLIAIFGGSLIGLAMGLVIRGGAALDGFEILAVFTTRKIGFTMSEVILFFNSIIFMVAALKFGIETAMYSLITYFAAVKMADYVVDGIEENTALTIISKDPETIKESLVVNFKKGITVYKGERGYLPGDLDHKMECDIIVIIVTRLEILNIREEVTKLDPEAFMYVNSIKETKGGVVKMKHGHK